MTKQEVHAALEDGSLLETLTKRVRGPKQRTEDAIQDAIVGALEKPDGFFADAQPLTTWLAIRAAGAITDAIRKDAPYVLRADEAAIEQVVAEHAPARQHGHTSRGNALSSADANAGEVGGDVFQAYEPSRQAVLADFLDECIEQATKYPALQEALKLHLRHGWEEKDKALFQKCGLGKPFSPRGKTHQTFINELKKAKQRTVDAFGAQADAKDERKAA